MPNPFLQLTAITAICYCFWRYPKHTAPLCVAYLAGFWWGAQLATFWGAAIAISCQQFDLVGRFSKEAARGGRLEFNAAISIIVCAAIATCIACAVWNGYLRQLAIPLISGDIYQPADAAGSFTGFRP